jgi:hypothetical protein
MQIAKAVFLFMDLHHGCLNYWFFGYVPHPLPLQFTNPEDSKQIATQYLQTKNYQSALTSLV